MPAADLLEIFSSIQGEGLFIGRRQLFVRFACCNLDCSYCDTKYASKLTPFASFENAPFSNRFYDERNPIPAFRLNEYIEMCFSLDNTIHSISFTGGEPLLQTEFIDFFLKNYKKERFFYLETNGTLPENLEKIIDLIDFVSMDIKMPYINNINFLKSQEKFLRISEIKRHQVKIVVSNGDSKETFLKAISIIKNRETPLIIQPDSSNMPDVHFLIDLQRVASTYLKHVMIIPQIHKFLGIK